MSGLAVVVSATVLAGLTPASVAQAATGVQPTRGSLLYETHDRARPLAELPLEHTDVRVQILGYVARVEVRQTFNNPFKKPLEAVYVFPMPDDAAVGEMFITVGDQTIRGVVRARDQARKLYKDAKRKGRTSALLDQERPNVFTQSVANIAPGKEVLVHIRYDVPLHYLAGTYEFVYPMVVGPRYIPGRSKGTRVGPGRAPDTDQVPDASRITPPARKPGSRAGHDVSLEVTVDPGAKIARLWSPTHKVVQRRARSLGRHAFKISLPPGQRIPNKDFVVRYRLANKKPAPSLIAQRDGDDGYFALTLHPPAQLDRSLIAPREVVFLIDSSSRMAGEPMSLAKRALRAALAKLEPDDRFRLVRFDGAARTLSSDLLAPTARNLRRATSWINAIHAAGPTEMIAGLREAFRGPVAPDRLRVLVLLSNGYVGNERAVLEEIRAQVDPSTRLYALGTGASTNRFLLEGAARAGRGAAEVVLLAEKPDQAIARFFERLRAPILTDVSLEWRQITVTDVLPAVLPDLFAGQPLQVVGRFARAGRAAVVVTGKLRGKPVRYRTRVTLAPHEGGFSGAASRGRSTRANGVVQGSIARLWARARINAHILAHRGRGKLLETAVTKLGVRHSLVTKYTSFVAIGELAVDKNGARRTFVVPVEMPEGVSYESVFHARVLAPVPPPVDKSPEVTLPDGTDAGGQGAKVDGQGDRVGSKSGGEQVYTDDDRDPNLADTLKPESTLQLSGSSSVATRRIEGASRRRWLLGLGLGFGLGRAANEHGAVSTIDLYLGRTVAPYWMVGAELGLRLPHLDAKDVVWSSWLLELRYGRLLGGRVHVLGGVGGALLSSGELGLSYMSAFELQVPLLRQLGTGLQLRLDGAAVADSADPRSYSLGLRLSF